jgi:branched-chain amino acid transport system substrate-binding protein
MMRITTCWSARLLGMAALCAALAAQAQPAAPLKIGVIGPFTGPSSDFGVLMLQGVQLATEEINTVGGYLGRHIELVIKDDQGNPDIGLKGSQELVAQGVTATLGFCNTGVAQKSLDIFQNAKLPLIIPCATGTPLTTKYPAPESYIFRTSPRDAIQAPFIVEEIVRRGWTKVAIFADTTGYGDAGLKDVEAALATKNLKAVHVARFALGVKDLREELKAARDAGADVVFSYTVGSENAVIANGRKDLKWKVPQVGAWPLSFPFFINGAKEAAEGAMMAQSFIAEPNNERRASFLSAYKRKFNKPMAVPMAAAQAYDATYLLTYSLFGIRDGNLAGPQLKAALENISRVYYGVVATYEHPFSLNDKDAISQNMLVMGKISNGVVTFARLEDAKRNAVVKRKN